jgi:PAS domain S-box-containing protein
VVLWQDVTERVRAFERGQWLNGLYALIAFLVVVAALYLGLVRVTGLLERQVQARTAALTASRNRLRTLIDASPALICFKDGEGRWLEANEAALELFGLQGRDYLGRTSAELGALLDPGRRRTLLEWAALDAAAWERGELVRGEQTIPTPAGPRVLDLIKVPIYDGLGQGQGLLMLGHDVTERERAARELRESEGRYRRLFCTNRAPMLLVDPRDGWVVEANAGAAGLSGYAPEELRQMHLADLLEGWGRRLAARLTRAARSGGGPLRLRHRHRDGAPRDLDVYLGTLELDEQVLCYAIVHEACAAQVGRTCPRCAPGS